MIDLYTVETPDGHKLSVMLEEVGLDREVIEGQLEKEDYIAGDCSIVD